MLLRALGFLQCSRSKIVLNTIFRSKSALEIGKQQWRTLSYHWKLGREGEARQVPACKAHLHDNDVSSRVLVTGPSDPEVKGPEFAGPPVILKDWPLLCESCLSALDSELAR